MAPPKHHTVKIRFQPRRSRFPMRMRGSISFLQTLLVLIDKHKFCFLRSSHALKANQTMILTCKYRLHSRLRTISISLISQREQKSQQQRRNETTAKSPIVHMPAEPLSTTRAATQSSTNKP